MAAFIVVPSFDWPEVAARHYSHIVFRAVENRVAMIKADVAFDLAIVDPYGRILERAVTPEGGAATLVADVPLGTVDAPAIRLGWLCLVGMVTFVVVDIITGSGCERHRV